MPVHIAIGLGLLTWAACSVAAIIVAAERRKDEYGGVIPATGRDVACVLLGPLYLLWLLGRGVWRVGREVVAAIRRGW